PVAHMSANILPQVLVDGPFGSASEDVFNHEIAMLFCAGIGCTPFASVLKSIWYRLSYPEGSFRLRKVYFFWVQRDTKSFEWFQDLLKAIEEEDDARMQEYGDSAEKMIEIHTYLTGKLNMTQMEHVHMNEDELDPITGLRSPTNFGRPNTDLIFRAVAHEHPATDVGVFFCGPVKLGSTIDKWKLDIRRVYRPEYDNVSGLNEDDNVSGLDEGEILSSKDVDIRQDSDQEHMGDMSTGPADLNSEEGLGPEGK
ncbi:hypothetical protein GGI01_001659, partial [Coemansia sp. RSA 376]